MNCAYDHASFHVRRGPREGYMNFRFQVTEMIEWGVNQNPKKPWGLQQTPPPPPPPAPKEKIPGPKLPMPSFPNLKNSHRESSC